MAGLIPNAPPTLQPPPPPAIYGTPLILCTMFCAHNDIPVLWNLSVRCNAKHILSECECDSQLPTEYFERCLGKHKKYSSCLWADQNTTLDEAEESMLGIALAITYYLLVVLICSCTLSFCLHIGTPNYLPACNLHNPIDAPVRPLSPHRVNICLRL